ncbi:hypothetical protein L3049_10725 [Labilibaculum sp. DW002]|uniref:Uncharacterized protein n=1 Tax=Paralabilibaculum antarcticum TaxID=2912572 RepID=A0ABT5VVD9_9BACT|nr:DUF6557 family protein [Labilibaculum sp. DW002]MDE5418483.1 hypothetical protein [Labilibaculum sp. DW002]
MKLKDLILKYKWDEIRTVLYNLYSDTDRNIEGYKLVFEKLKVIGFQASKFEILVQNIEDNGEKYVHVNALDLSDKCSGDSPTTYSLMFTPWNEWAGMSINSESLLSFSEVDLIAHCLWEMTYCGFDEEEISKLNKELDE